MVKQYLQLKEEYIEGGMTEEAARKKAARIYRSQFRDEEKEKIVTNRKMRVRRKKCKSGENLITKRLSLFWKH